MLPARGCAQGRAARGQPAGGPAAGRHGAGVSRRLAAACGRDLRPGCLVGPSGRRARGGDPQIPGSAFTALAFSRDGRRLALGAGLAWPLGRGAALYRARRHVDPRFRRPRGRCVRRGPPRPTVRNWPRPPSTRQFACGTSARAVADGVFRGHSDFVYSLSLYAGRPLASFGGQGPDDQTDQHSHVQGRAHVQRTQR